MDVSKDIKISFNVFGCIIGDALREALPLPQKCYPHAPQFHFKNYEIIYLTSLRTLTILLRLLIFFHQLPVPYPGNMTSGKMKLPINTEPDDDR